MAQKMLAYLKGFVREASKNNNEDSFDTLCVEPTVLCRPARPTKPFPHLVFELWPMPTDRLVGAPTDDGDLHHARGALEKLGIVAVLAMVKLKKIWAARRNWLMWPANPTVRTAISTRS